MVGIYVALRRDMPLSWRDMFAGRTWETLSVTYGATSPKRRGFLIGYLLREDIFRKAPPLGELPQGQRPEGERGCAKIEKIPGDYRDLFLFIVGVFIIVLFLFLRGFECGDLGADEVEVGGGFRILLFFVRFIGEEEEKRG